ncbi:MAG: hypothetical protein ABIL44_01770 [candidate division WOR-3 bacterium]
MKLALSIIIVFSVAQVMASNLPAEVENSIAIFKIQGSKYTALIYTYFKSAALMVKCYAEAETSLCSPIEFGYFMGGMESLLPTLIYNYYYQTYGEEAANQLNLDDYKAMRTPFEKPKIEYSFEITEKGFIYTMLIRTGSEETTTRKSLTWKEIYETE